MTLDTPPVCRESGRFLRGAALSHIKIAQFGDCKVGLCFFSRLGLPDVLFVVDVGYENIAVLEASKLGIPIVGIVDTNNSPDNIDYIVPGNDDSMRAIKLYTKMVADAILVGKESIVADLNSKDEMIELEDEESSPTRVPVKISAKKSAVAAASKAAKPVETVKSAPEAVVAEEAVAKAAESEDAVTEDAVTEDAVTEEVAAELEVASVETAGCRSPSLPRSSFSANWSKAIF